MMEAKEKADLSRNTHIAVGLVVVSTTGSAAIAMMMMLKYLFI